MLIGLAFITLGAIATALSGGSFAAAFVCGLSVAMKSAVTGAIVGAVMGGLTSAFSDGNVLEGTASGLMNGLIDGFMWGGITAGVSNVIKPGSFCFIAGTKVLTDSGQKNIEDIEVGDQVLAYDEETGVTSYKPVLHLFRNTTKEWYHIQAANEEIICTGEHPFYVIGKGFIKASELNCCDKLLNANGAVVSIDCVWVERLETEQTTYNFEVADFHTYYVSELHILVHNRCRITEQVPKRPDRITGYTKHGLQQALGRDGHGVSPKGILDAFRNPKNVVYDAGRDTFKFIGQRSITVLNHEGKIVTAIAKSSIFWRFP